MPSSGYIPPVQGASPFGAFASGAAEGVMNGITLAQKAYELKLKIDKNKLSQAGGDTAIGAHGADESRPADQTSMSTGTPPGTGTGGTGGGGTSGTSGGGGGGTGGWGPYGQTAVDTLKQLGWTDAAIQGAIANGLAEGGFAVPWNHPQSGEQSFGHWQFNANGELPGYQQWAHDNGVQNLQDTGAQARYVAYRMNQINPAYASMTDPKAATDAFEMGFERPKGAAPGQRYAQLNAAQGYLSGAGATTAAPPAQQAPAPTYAEGGAPSRFTGQPRSTQPIQPGTATAPPPAPRLATGGAIGAPGQVIGGGPALGPPSVVTPQLAGAPYGTPTLAMPNIPAIGGATPVLAAQPPGPQASLYPGAGQGGALANPVAAVPTPAVIGNTAQWVPPDGTSPAIGQMAYTAPVNRDTGLFG